MGKMTQKKNQLGPFEKMTPREQKLAIAVLCLVPAALLFMSVFWVIGKYGENNQEFMSLSAALSSEEDRELSAIKAERRRNYYNSVSLSPRFVDAGNDYLIWLKTLLNDTNLNYKTFNSRNAGEIRQNNQVIGEKKKFSFTATGKLDEVTEFLTRFYSVDTLHRINSMKITPGNESGGKNKKVRTGKLSVNFVIEIAALSTAEDNPEFAKNVRVLARDKADYRAAILRRNIFGPANNIPTISARPSSSYTSMSDARITVTGKDADDNDKLSFEVVESDVEGAELAASSGKRSTRLTVPGQKAGTYNVKLRVTDSGFPPKESFADVKVTFKDKVVKKKEEPKPKKAFIHAKETRITGITRLRDGNWQVWIKVRTTGEKYKLLVGESFELDKHDWVVESIQPHSAVFLVDGKQLKFNDRVTFDKPLGEEESTQ